MVHAELPIHVSTRGFKPCGACAAYVPELTGCPHWKPGTAHTLRRAIRVPGHAAASMPSSRTASFTAEPTCTCGKKPGPPLPHLPGCAFLTGGESYNTIDLVRSADEEESDATDRTRLDDAG